MNPQTLGMLPLNMCLSYKNSNLSHIWPKTHILCQESSPISQYSRATKKHRKTQSELLEELGCAASAHSPDSPVAITGQSGRAYRIVRWRQFAHTKQRHRAYKAHKERPYIDIATEYKLNILSRSHRFKQEFWNILQETSVQHMALMKHETWNKCH